MTLLSRQFLAVTCGVAVIVGPAEAQTEMQSPIWVISDSQPNISSQVGAYGPVSFADLAERVLPAVIGVSTKAPMPAQGLPNDLFDKDSPRQATPLPGNPTEGEVPKLKEMASLGSGFFISPDGYAVTNNHVVENADTAEIRTQDDKKYTAKVVGRDPISDLALLKVDGSNDFSYVRIAERLPRVGDWVLAVGSPFGLGGTVTAGIVSARQRNIESVSNEDLIQIDAPINQGDSGGPIFDREGNVIGVNTMIVTPSGGSIGIGFAIPGDTIKDVIPQLKAKGSVTRGWIGVEIQSITPDLAEGLGIEPTRGAIVGNVQRDGPAAKAKLTKGDVITAVDGQAIKDAHDLTKTIQRTSPGSLAQLSLLRNGDKSSISVTVGQLPQQLNTHPPDQKMSPLR